MVWHETTAVLAKAHARVVLRFNCGFELSEWGAVVMDHARAQVESNNTFLQKNQKQVGTPFYPTAKYYARLRSYTRASCLV
jgi:hypothetical protein